MHWSLPILHTVAALSVLGCSPGATPIEPLLVDESIGALDIRSPDGKVIVAADEIRHYDWTTHSMTWSPGVKKRLFSDRTKELIEGSPFAVCVGGRSIYTGKFVSSFSSHSVDAVVIRDFSWENERDPIPDDVARLELGYPSAEHFKGQDLRAHPEIRKAVEAAGKLTND